MSANPATAVAAGLADVTTGCTTAHHVPGYCAAPGYDMASGVGTITNAPAFVTALATSGARPGSG